MTNLIVTFRNFANARNKQLIVLMVTIYSDPQYHTHNGISVVKWRNFDKVGRAVFVLKF